jgi:hypothetical protein
MKKDIYIHHHLGMGDHIICNGMIREICKDYDNVNLFVKRNNLINVSFMYRDSNKINLIPIHDDFDIYENYKNYEILQIGFSNLGRLMGHFNIGWDEAFYKQLDIDFTKRWDSFYVMKDLDSENKLYEKLNPNNDKFCIIHSNGSDGVDRINYDEVNPNLLKIIINPSYTNNIFDYYKLINEAEQIHCVDSSFLHLSDSIPTRGELFYHNLKYTRNANETHKQIKNWKLV